MMNPTMNPCPACGKLDQPHDPCACPDTALRPGAPVRHARDVQRGTDYYGIGRVERYNHSTDSYSVAFYSTRCYGVHEYAAHDLVMVEE